MSAVAPDDSKIRRQVITAEGRGEGDAARSTSPVVTATTVLVASGMMSLPQCPYHPRKELEMYCRVHKEAICSTCTMTRHLACQQTCLHQVTNVKNDHPPSSPFQGIEEAAEELAGQVQTSVAQASQNKESRLMGVAAQVEARNKEIQSQLRDLTALLEEDRDRIIHAATARCHHHVEALQQAAQDKTSILTRQQESLVAQALSLARDRATALEAVQALDARQHPLQVIHTSLRLLGHMDEEETVEADRADLEPLEEANLHVALPSADGLVAELGKRGWAGPLVVDPSKCSLQGPDTMAYFAGDGRCTLMLEVRDVRGELVEIPERAVAVHGWLMTELEKAVQVTVEAKAVGVYELGFGMDKEWVGNSVAVEASVEGRTVQGCPKHVRVVGGLNDSTILTERYDRERQALIGFIPTTSHNFRRLYRATQDGWGSSQFHNRCDNQGPTITILQTADSRSIFGGYTSTPWFSPSCGGCSMTDTKAFLFSLVNTAGRGPIKLELKPGQQDSAVYSHSGNGPVFGGESGWDLVISSHGNSAKISTCCYLGHNYQLPPGCDARTFLAGSPNFQLSEMEVYAVV